MWEIENEKFRAGYSLLAGVDEAGRGPLAGPVAAAAVILPPNIYIEGLNDSKKLSEKVRDGLFDVIKSVAVSYSVALVDNAEIDRLNILNATFKAMRQAVLGLAKKPDFVLIDGNRIKGLDDFAHECIVKGDAKSASVAAASILAKVTRDRIMCEYDKAYPQYGFSEHKGYPTAHHYEMIKNHGISDIHRRSFRLEKVS